PAHPSSGHRVRQPSNCRALTLESACCAASSAARRRRRAQVPKRGMGMRKVVTGAFVSLDGVMQAPGGPEEDPTGGFAFGGWVWPYADEAFGQAIDRLFGERFDLLLGRKTYEIFAAHWPYAEGGEHDSIARLFNAATKYVATRSTMELTWSGSVALHDAAADVARLKREDGPLLVTQGSSDL